jgi:hypothetical protein
MSSTAFYQWRSKYEKMDASLISEMKQLQAENARLKRMYADIAMQNELELNLRIKPRKRLKRERPDPLSVPDQPDQVWSIPRPTGDCAAICR